MKPLFWFRLVLLGEVMAAVVVIFDILLNSAIANSPHIFIRLDRWNEWGIELVLVFSWAIQIPLYAYLDRKKLAAFFEVFA